MSDDVFNSILVWASKKNADRVKSEMENLHSSLELLKPSHDHADLTNILNAKLSDLGKIDGKTHYIPRKGDEFFDGNNEDLLFKSAWGRDDALQNYICAYLAQFDQSVVVINSFYNEFNKDVGVRLVSLNASQLVEIVEDIDVEGDIEDLEDESEIIEEIQSLLWMTRKKVIDNFIKNHGVKNLISLTWD